VDGQWPILDSRHLARRVTAMVGSAPKFVLAEDGARRFVLSSRTGQGAKRRPTAPGPARSVRPAWSLAQRQGEQGAHLFFSVIVCSMAHRQFGFALYGVSIFCSGERSVW
jgi:hypothetical protein